MGADFGAKRLSTGRYGVTSPNFNFSPNFTQGPDPLVATNNGGAGFASFLIGLGSGSVRSDGPGQSLLYRYFGGYFQDDWKATSRLTLNLGIRYDYSGPWTERYNRITDLDYTSLSPLQIAGLQLKGGLQFPGVNGVPRGQFDPDRTDIAPRFGFAYALNSKTVLRGGFGIFIGPPTGGGFNGAVAISGFESFTTWVSSVDGITPTNYLSNPFPDGFVKATGSGQGLGTLLGQSISGNDRGTRMPHAEQWNFDIQRTIPGNFLLDISYAGSRGLHLMGNLEYDALPNQYLSQGDALRQLTPNPFFGTITNGPLAVPQIQRGQLLRPYPQFTGVNARSVSYGASTYHALQAKFERRFSKGFSFLAAYTFSKLMDDVTMTTGFGGESFYGGGIQDWGNRRNERAPAVWDAPHTLAMNWVWDLPIGPHRKFLGDRKWLGAIAGNWQINGITLFRSGVPLQLTTSANTLNNYSGAQRPNWSGTDPHVSGPISKRIDRYFDPAAFVSPPPYTFGNVPRSIGNLRGPGVASLDFSLFRNIPLTEKATLQFRCETFNVLNHPQFGLPNTSIGNPSAGVISSQVNQPRDIQFALKLLY
jgi:hypothetical protein